MEIFVWKMGWVGVAVAVEVRRGMRLVVFNPFSEVCRCLEHIF